MVPNTHRHTRIVWLPFGFYLLSSLCQEFFVREKMQVLQNSEITSLCPLVIGTTKITINKPFCFPCADGRRTRRPINQSRKDRVRDPTKIFFSFFNIRSTLQDEEDEPFVWVLFFGGCDGCGNHDGDSLFGSGNFPGGRRQGHHHQ